MQQLFVDGEISSLSIVCGSLVYPTIDCRLIHILFLLSSSSRSLVSKSRCFWWHDHNEISAVFLPHLDKMSQSNILHARYSLLSR